MGKDSFLKPLIKHLKLKKMDFSAPCPWPFPGQKQNKSSPRARTWNLDIALLSSEYWIFLSSATPNTRVSLTFQEWATFQAWYHPAASAVWHGSRDVHMEHGIESVFSKAHPNVWHLWTLSDGVLSGQHLPN